MNRYQLTYPITMPFASENFNVLFKDKGDLSPHSSAVFESLTRDCRLLHWSQSFDEAAKLPISSRQGFLALCFNLGDTIRYNINGLSSGIIRKNHYNLVYIPNGELEFQKGNYTSFSIQITPHFLNAYSEVYSLKDFLQKVAYRMPAVASTGHLFITPSIKQNISMILMNRHTGGYRDHFINLHTMQVLFDGLRHIQECGIPYETRSFYAQPDIQYGKKIKEAWEYLCNNLRNQIVIADLEFLTGLNKSKLERGFKTIYGATIFTVLFEERMKKAKVLLLDPKMTIRQISYEVGFRNLSNFSEAFKRKFKCSPSAWREGELKRTT